jgi:predicted RNase H-like HicB family nuclease
LAEYIALIHKDPDSDYSVSFPDFPGCITAGATLDEAREQAAEALAFHITGMIEDGQELPTPSPMATIMTERENRDAVAFLVALPDRAERHIRIQVTMPQGLVAEIDARTDNRSKFLADAARAALRPVTVRMVRPVARKAQPPKLVRAVGGAAKKGPRRRAKKAVRRTREPA